MRKFKKYFLLAIASCLFISSLTACGKPSPASLGIERPASSRAVFFEKLGLGVYGQFNYDYDNKIGIMQIDDKDLPKIKAGYSVSFLMSLGKIGTVKSLPKAETVTVNGKCNVEIDVKRDVNASYKLMSGNKTVSIDLPPENNRWCLETRCIQEGNNGKKYVWSTTKKEEDLIQEQDWQLKEVKTGETDGVRTEILSGLQAGERVLRTSGINDFTYMAE
jgi:hypothetical protein